MTRYAAMTDEDLMETYYEEEDEEEANQAFAEIDRRYRPRFLMSLLVPGYNKRFIKLHKMLGVEQKAEELAGEALFKAADTKGRPSARWSRARKPLHPWLFGILHNVAVSYLRRKPSRIRADSDLHSGDAEETDSPLALAADPTPSADEILQHQALLAVLRTCMDELPEELRQVCELIFDKGLKQTEVAALLKLSTPTLTRRKQLAVEQLRHCLRCKGVVPPLLL